MKLIKRILILKDIAYHLKNRKIFNELVERKSSESKNLEKKVNPYNLIYKYKSKGKIPKSEWSKSKQKLSKSGRIIQKFKRWKYKPQKSTKKLNQL